MADEGFFYNAASLALESSYSNLTRLYKECGTWQSVWLKVKSGAEIGANEAWENVLKNGLKLALFYDMDYPARLKEIPLPPFGIYIKGNPTCLKNDCVAVVGTRRASSEGKSHATRFAESLASNKITVVSGLALGIDRAAHEGSLMSGGPTAAVLANGLDKVYPASHAALSEKIIEKGGCLISEYPPSSPPMNYRFLERNRIISGLARAVLIIEAPQASGAMATARFALDQNRDVFVVPGPANSPLYAGSHGLIRDGGTLTANPEQILSDLGIQNQTRPPLFKNLNNEESKIICALTEAVRALTIDEIIETTNMEPKVAIQTVGFLVLKNAIKEYGNAYGL